MEVVILCVLAALTLPKNASESRETERETVKKSYASAVQASQLTQNMAWPMGETRAKSLRGFRVEPASSASRSAFVGGRGTERAENRLSVKSIELEQLFLPIQSRTVLHKCLHRSHCAGFRMLRMVKDVKVRAAWLNSWKRKRGRLR